MQFRGEFFNAFNTVNLSNPRTTLGTATFGSITGAGSARTLMLVRSVWRAEVELMPWEPRFEIAHRRVVPATGLLSHLWMEEGFEPIYHRALAEAGLM